MSLTPRTPVIGIAVLALASCIAFAGAAGAAPKPVNIYGVGNQNNIWEIDPLAKQFTEVDDTALPQVNGSNSMAYDATRDQFFFTYAGDRSLRFWDRLSFGAGSTRAVATWAGIGVGTDPANAAYYDNAYWYVTGGQRTLHRVAFTYAGNEPTFASDTAIDLAPTGYPAGLSYGDIAINARTGVLYGTATNGVFYRLSLNEPRAGSYRQIANTGKSLQVAFDADYTTLFAHEHPTGKWFTLNTDTGALTDLDFTTIVPGSSQGFRDLGGSATTDAGSTCSIAPPGDSDDQFAQVGTTVRRPLKVRVVGPDGAPQAGVAVTFTVTAGGGTIGGAASAEVVTDDDGVATAPAWRLGPSPGRNAVRADNVGTVCNLTFSATATAGPPTDDQINGGGGGDRDPQKPLRPIDPPATLNECTSASACVGITPLLRVPVRTNAAQVARVRLNCTIRGTRRAAPGNRCRAITAGRVLSVRVTCGRPLWVRLLVTAPGTDDYLPYRYVKTWTTTGRCAVTG